MSTQGANAVISYKAMSAAVYTWLERLNYNVLPAKGKLAGSIRNSCRIDRSVVESPVDPQRLIGYLRRNFPGQKVALTNFAHSLASIYGVRHLKNVIIFNDPDLYWMDIKAQDKGGTTDEKFPFMVMTAEMLYPVKSIFLVDGRGFRPYANRWLQKSAAPRNYIYTFFSLDAFREWALKNL